MMLVGIIYLNLGRLILKMIATELVGPAASIFGGADIELYGGVKAQLVFPLEEITAPGQGTTKIKYRQATLMYGNCDIDWFLIIPKSITLSVNLEQYLLSKRVEVYLDSSHQVRTTSYDYDFDYYKWQQPMNYQTVESDGQRETVYKYQPVVQKRYRWEDKSYDTKSGVSISLPVQLWTKHALGVLKSEEIKEAASGETLQRQEYQYDLKKMRPTKIKTIRGSSSNQENYRYDNWGNVIYYHNADNGLKRYRHYLNTNSSTAAFPAKFKTPVDSDFSQVEVDKHIHNLLADSFVLNQSPVGGSVPVQSHHVYSAVGNLVLKADWDDQQSKWLKSKFSYDQYGNLIKQIDPLGNLSEIEYDKEYSQAYPTKTIRKGQGGEAIKDVDGQAIAGEYIITQQGYYKSTGLKKWEIDANGALTEYQYDILGRLIKTIYPDDDDQYAGTIGSLKPANYSKRANNPVKIQYYNDNTYQTTVVNASEDLAVNDYKIRDNRITEPVYNKSRYHYDRLNRWVKLETFKLKEDGSSEILSTSFYYDQANRRTAVKDAEGYVSFTEYDPLDRETKIILADGSKDLVNSKDNQLYTKLEYEQNQRTMIDAEGNKTEELKDWSGNLIKVNQYLRNEKISSSAQYDQLGNRVELTDAEGRITQYSYDSLGRLREEILSEDIVKVYQRADEGKLEYSYDAGGNRTERHKIVGNDDSTAYQYYPDSNRLKKASYTVSGKTYKECYYIYDANGNLTAKGNHVTKNTDGSLTLDKDSPGSSYWEYEYTADNLLQKVYYKGELKAEYSYDADGKRILAKTVEGTTHFVFDYSGKAIFEDSTATDKDGNTESKQTSYIYALSKQMARVEGVIGGEGEVIYYHHDNLGSTRLMTDQAGEVVFDQDYLPFGGDLAVVGDLEPRNDQGERYKYTGQREETSIGLYYYGARFYDPELGRFVSEDPIEEDINKQLSQKENIISGQYSINGMSKNKSKSDQQNNIVFDLYERGINPYIYGKNNPLKYIDPDGRTSITAEYYMKKYSSNVEELSNKYNVSESLLNSVIWNENKYRNNIHLAKDFGGLYLQGTASLGLCQVQMKTAAFLDTNPDPKSLSKITTKKFQGLKRESFNALTEKEKTALKEKLMYNDKANLEYAAKYLSLVKQASGQNDPKIILSNYNRSPDFWDESANDYGNSYEEYDNFWSKAKYIWTNLFTPDLNQVLK